MSTQTLQMDVFAFCDYADQTKNDHTSPIVSLNDIQSRLLYRVNNRVLIDICSYLWRRNGQRL